jgi:hypothetical protein
VGYPKSCEIFVFPTSPLQKRGDVKYPESWEIFVLPTPPLLGRGRGEVKTQKTVLKK